MAKDDLRPLYCSSPINDCAIMRKKKNLAIINDDPWLEPYSDAINGRHQDAVNKIAELTGDTGNLVEFANAYNYYGLHHTANCGWVFR